MAHRWSPSRSDRALQRRIGRRRPRACILIVCEGKETEPRYFVSFRQQLRLTTLEVEVCPSQSGSAPRSVVEYAMHRKHENLAGVREDEAAIYDQIWCVFDVDKHTTPNEALKTAQDKRLSVALSNPCFEYWFLLHFEDTNRCFLSLDKLIRHLRREFLPGYEKRSDVFPKLWPLTDKAMARAQRFEANRSAGEGVRDHNSSTDVHKLVLVLKNVAARPC